MISICVLSVIYSCLYCTTKLKEFKSTQCSLPTLRCSSVLWGEGVFDNDTEMVPQAKRRSPMLKSFFPCDAGKPLKMTCRKIELVLSS